MTDKSEVCAGILAALPDIEFGAVSATLASAGWQVDDVSSNLERVGIRRFVEPKGSFPIYIGTFGRAGQAHAATETIVFLERVDPALVVLCGIAGSLSEQNWKKCDVVIGDEIIWDTIDRMEDKDTRNEVAVNERWRSNASHGYNVDFLNRLRPELHSLVDHQKLRSSGRDFSVHWAQVFSWNYVATGFGTTEKILDRQSKASVVEMEGGGFLTAVERFSQARWGRKIPAFVIKGVSDYTNKKDNDEVI